MVAQLDVALAQLEGWIRDLGAPPVDEEGRTEEEYYRHLDVGTRCEE